MSLTFAALRFSLVMALRDRTLAGPFVHDSEIAPVDETATGGRPEILVYSDDFEFARGNWALHENRGALKMTIAAIVTAKMENATGGAVARIPATDAGLELTVDLLCRQIEVALSDPANEFAEFFKAFLRGPLRFTTSRRASSARDGLRLAGRELNLEVEPIADVAPGASLPRLWADLFDAAAAAGEDSASWADIMTRLLAAPPREDPGVMAALYRLSRADAAALGVASRAEAARVEAVTFEAAP